jgi:hypothetical protein
MLTRTQFAELAVGDLVETSAMLPKLSEEPVVLRLTDKTAEKATFVVTYFGVTLGRWIAKLGKGGVEWSTS